MSIRKGIYLDEEDFKEIQTLSEVMKTKEVTIIYALIKYGLYGGNKYEIINQLRK